MPRIIRIVPKKQDAYQQADVEKTFFLTVDCNHINNTIIKFNCGIPIGGLAYRDNRRQVQNIPNPTPHQLNLNGLPGEEQVRLYNIFLIDTLLRYILGHIAARNQVKKYIQQRNNQRNRANYPHFHGNAEISTTLLTQYLSVDSRNISLNGNTYVLNSVGVDIPFAGRLVSGKYGNLEFKFFLEKPDGSLDPNFQCVLNIHLNSDSNKIYDQSQVPTIPIYPVIKKNGDSFRNKIKECFNNMLSNEIRLKLSNLERLGLDANFSAEGYALPGSFPAYDDYLKAKETRTLHDKQHKELQAIRRQVSSYFWATTFGALGFISFAALVHVLGPRILPKRNPSINHNAMSFFSGLGGAIACGYAGHSYGRQSFQESRPGL